MRTRTAGASRRPRRARPAHEPITTCRTAGRARATTTRRRHGHGPWHGPHESPTPMTFPLMALAVGAIVAGFVGIPAALGGGNAIEHFLEPSFTASASRRRRRRGSRRAAPAAAAAEHGGAGAATHASRGGRARPDGVLGADRRRRHRAGVEVLRHEPGDLRAPRRSGSPARTACCRTSTTSTSSTTRRSSPGTMAGGPRAVDVRSQGRRRRGQRHRLADACSARGSRA